MPRLANRRAEQLGRRAGAPSARVSRCLAERVAEPTVRGRHAGTERPSRFRNHARARQRETAAGGTGPEKARPARPSELEVRDAPGGDGGAEHGVGGGQGTETVLRHPAHLGPGRPGCSHLGRHWTGSTPTGPGRPARWWRRTRLPRDRRRAGTGHRRAPWHRPPRTRPDPGTGSAARPAPRPHPAVGPTAGRCVRVHPWPGHRPGSTGRDRSPSGRPPTPWTPSRSPGSSATGGCWPRHRSRPGRAPPACCGAAGPPNGP